MLNRIAYALKIRIASEYEPEYWGFATQDEWDQWQSQEAKADEDEFYLELLKYLRREPHNIPPGTVGMELAEHAKKLVHEDPALLLPENKDKLLSAITS